MFEVYADVLTNRKPPYSVAGGVFDAMTATRGRFHSVTNSEARSAEKLWNSVEAVVPNPAASVALASLIKAVEEDMIDPEAHILLNMTGGGLERSKEDLALQTIRPKAFLDKNIPDDELLEVLG